jgi:hypothetical protein
MTTIFPNNNLPISSQQWGREIQKRLESLETEIAKQKTNTSSSDAQIQSSYNRLDETITEITKLSEVDSKYSVNVDNLVGQVFTSNGINFQITNPDIRREYPDTIIGQITSESAGIVFGSAFIDIDGDLVPVSLTREFFRLLIDGGPSVAIGGSTYFPTIKIKPGLIVQGTPGLVLQDLVGGGTTGASIDTTGKVIRTPSSERYKQDIEPLEVDYSDLLSLEPKRFRFKNEASESEDARYYAGFIAEEVAETSLTDFVAYKTSDDGTKIPDGVYYGELSAALLTAIKHQDELIKSLASRLDALENKDKV